ncbi:MAG: tripartite tricarboxylate transporter TctB family protein [Alphaproteobacteria bacterium]
MRLGWQVGSASFLLLFVCAIWLSARLPLQDALGPGPGFFPLWLAMIGGVLSAVLLVQTVRKPVPGHEEEALMPDRPAIRRILAVLILLAAAALALDPLGFRLTALLFTAILLPALGARSLIVIALFSLTASFAVFHVFYYMLKVPLPIGVFGI